MCIYIYTYVCYSLYVALVIRDLLCVVCVVYHAYVMCYVFDMFLFLFTIRRPRMPLPKVFSSE